MSDQHNGKGGSYVMEDGKRVLLERTDHPAVAQPAAQPTPPAQPRPAKQTNKPKVRGASNA